MGVMKRSLLLVFAVLFAICLQTSAEVTTGQLTDPEYMINGGYSEAAAEEVMISKNRAMGQPCEPLYEKKHNKFVKFLKNCYSYIDPMQDSDERYHHDIKMSPSYTDL